MKFRAETIESDKVSGDEEDKEKCAEDTHVEDASPSSHTRSDFVRPNEVGITVVLLQITIS